MRQFYTREQDVEPVQAGMSTLFLCVRLSFVHNQEKCDQNLSNKCKDLQAWRSTPHLAAALALLKWSRPTGCIRMPNCPGSISIEEASVED